MNILTADEIRKVEEKENEIGTKFLKLMSLAGSGCARIIMDSFAPEDGPVVVVCGKGKNGGDGFVIARKLMDNDYNVSIVLAFGEPSAEDAVINFHKATEIGIPVIRAYPDWHYAEQSIASAGLLVDAMFGIGFHGAANESQAYLFDLMNRAPAPVVAIDVPSGINADSGLVEGTCIHADLTISMSALKPCQVFFPAREYCGVTQVLDIGILEESFQCVTPSLMTYTEQDIKDRLPVRARTSHKNDFGHALLICGSKRMPGAGCMAANACLRAGAGLTTAAFPESAYPAFAAQLPPEIMRYPLAESPEGEFSFEALPELRKAMKKATVLLLGPGIGSGEAIRQLVHCVLSEAVVPVVLDADGLNAAASDPDVLKACKAPVIVTPHPGEMARLTGLSVSEINQNRTEIARNFAKEYNVTVLLKGPDTVVASPEKEKLYVNITGNQGLAKGGSGDTLAGIITGLVSGGMTPFHAAAVGAYLHGACAERAAEQIALQSMCASDVTLELPYVLRELEA